MPSLIETIVLTTLGVVALPIVVLMSPVLVANEVKDRRNRKAHKVAQQVAEKEAQKKSAEANAKFLYACNIFNTFRETGSDELMSEDDIPESAKFLLECLTKEDLIQAAMQVREEVIVFYGIYRPREYHETLARMDGGGANSYLAYEK